MSRGASRRQLHRRGAWGILRDPALARSRDFRVPACSTRVKSTVEFAPPLAALARARDFCVPACSTRVKSAR